MIKCCCEKNCASASCIEVKQYGTNQLLVRIEEDGNDNVVFLTKEAAIRLKLELEKTINEIQ